MSTRVYLVTEGVHDVSFLGKVLAKGLGLNKLETATELEPAWHYLLPKYPHEDSLRPSVPAPTFYRRPGVSVAIVSAQGIDKIEKRLRSHYNVLTDKGFALDAVGVVLDADRKEDKQKSPAKRFEEVAHVFASLGLPRPAVAEAVSGEPRTGVFILPGGEALGTLEDVLLDCAAVVYPALGCRAVRFIDGLDRAGPDFIARDLEEIGALSGRNKAVLAAMAAVLKPGKAIQASIEDHRWIEPRTLALPRVAAVLRFLQQLLGAASSAGMTAGAT